MKCQEARQLISLYLDEDVSTNDAVAFEGHMVACKMCSRELALQKRITSAIWAIGQEEVHAPPEFCGLVMAKLCAEQQIVKRKLSVAWRRAVAFAATVLLLAGGSAGVTAGLKLASQNPNLIGYVSPTAVITPSTAEGDDAGVIGNQDTPANKAPDDSGTGISTVREGNGGQADPGKTDTADSGSGTEKNSPGIVAIAAQPAEKQALLSEELKVTNTSLKVSIKDLDNARLNSLALATRSGATIQTLPVQTRGKQVLVMRLTVAPDRVKELIAGLCNLGAVIDRQEETRDLTVTYNEALVQYHDLQTRIQITNDVGEKQQLREHLIALKQQLDGWEFETGKQVIVLWLEEN